MSEFVPGFEAAFPSAGALNEYGARILQAEKGMTMRDWFAGQALSSGTVSMYNYSDIAKAAYKLADAMLEARKS